MFSNSNHFKLFPQIFKVINAESRKTFRGLDISRNVAEVEDNHNKLFAVILDFE